MLHGALRGTGASTQPTGIHGVHTTGTTTTDTIITGTPFITSIITIATITAMPTTTIFIIMDIGLTPITSVTGLMPAITRQPILVLNNARKEKHCTQGLILKGHPVSLQVTARAEDPTPRPQLQGSLKEVPAVPAGGQ